MLPLADGNENTKFVKGHCDLLERSMRRSDQSIQQIVLIVPIVFPDTLVQSLTCLRCHDVRRTQSPIPRVDVIECRPRAKTNPLFRLE